MKILFYRFLKPRFLYAGFYCSGVLSNDERRKCNTAKNKQQQKSKTKSKYIIPLTNDKRAKVLKHNFLYLAIKQTFLAPLNYANIFKASV